MDVQLKSDVAVVSNKATYPSRRVTFTIPQRFISLVEGFQQGDLSQSAGVQNLEVPTTPVIEEGFQQGDLSQSAGAVP